MCAFVGIQMAYLSATEVAILEVANIRFLPGVYALVGHQTARCGTAMVTSVNITNMRPFTCVGALMGLQVVRLGAPMGTTVKVADNRQQLLQRSKLSKWMIPRNSKLRPLKGCKHKCHVGLMKQSFKHMDNQPNHLARLLPCML